METEYEDGERTTSFVGECVCDHPREEHSWGICDVFLGLGTEGKIYCECKAGWEE